MIFRLALVEFKRLVKSSKYIISFSLLALLGIGLIIFTTGGLYGAPDVSGQWTAWSALLKVALPIFLLMPLFIGFVTGASLAEDRHSGYQHFLQVRVSSRLGFVFSRAVGILGASFFGGIASFLLLTIFAFVTLPSYPIDHNVANIDTLIFKQSPYLYLGLIAIMTGLGVSAMSGIACLASVWIKNPYIVGSIPIGILLFSIVLESIFKSKYLEIFPLLTLQNRRFTFSMIAIAWLVYIVLFYGLTIIFFDNKTVLNFRKRSLH